MFTISEEFEVRQYYENVVLKNFIQNIKGVSIPYTVNIMDDKEFDEYLQTCMKKAKIIVKLYDEFAKKIAEYEKKILIEAMSYNTEARKARLALPDFITDTWLNIEIVDDKIATNFSDIFYHFVNAYRVPNCEGIYDPIPELDCLMSK